MLSLCIEDIRMSPPDHQYSLDRRDREKSLLEFCFLCRIRISVLLFVILVELVMLDLTKLFLSIVCHEFAALRFRNAQSSIECIRFPLSE